MKKWNNLSLSLFVTLIYSIISLLTYFTSFGVSPFSDLYAVFTFIESMTTVTYIWLFEDYPKVDAAYFVILLMFFIVLWIGIFVLINSIRSSKPKT